jgi:hypothetical protein
MASYRSMAADGFPPVVVDASGREEDSFPTIERAMKACNTHDRILVLPGTYEECVLLDKPVEICGREGKTNETIIKVRLVCCAGLLIRV